MHQTFDMAATALRYTLQELDNAIRYVRVCVRTGSPRTAEFTAEYLRLVREAHEVKAKVQALSSIWQPICEPHLPMPIREQLVGLSAEDRKRLEWTPFEPKFSPHSAA